VLTARLPSSRASNPAPTSVGRPLDQSSITSGPVPTSHQLEKGFRGSVPFPNSSRSLTPSKSESARNGLSRWSISSPSGMPSPSLSFGLNGAGVGCTGGGAWAAPGLELVSLGSVLCTKTSSLSRASSPSVSCASGFVARKASSPSESPSPSVSGLFGSVLYWLVSALSAMPSLSVSGIGLLSPGTGSHRGRASQQNGLPPTAPPRRHGEGDYFE